MIEATCEDEEDLAMQQEVTRNVMGVFRTFSAQGHSGYTASYTINLINRLLNHLPILPLTGEDDEWDYAEESAQGMMLQQNLRCSAVFRHNFDNSTAFMVEGKVFSDDGGMSWFTDHNSNVSVKFPFKVPTEPEYVYLEVAEESTEESTEESVKE